MTGEDDLSRGSKMELREPYMGHLYDSVDSAIHVMIAPSHASVLPSRVGSNRIQLGARLADIAKDRVCLSALHYCGESTESRKGLG